MTASTLITDYLGRGLAASRPASPSVPSGGIAVYYATDTLVFSVWNGTSWSPFGAGAWTAAPVTNLGTSIAVNSGTVDIALVAGTNVTISGNNTITAASGITSLVGGTNVTISGGNTITAASGITTLVAGTNVTISGGNTIAASASGIASLVGGTGITISGSNTITNSGIVSLVAGSNVTISGGNTIAASLSDLWNVGTVTALASNQLTDSGGTLAVVTGPTIQVVQGSTAMVVNSNTSTSLPTLGGNTGLLIVGANNAGAGGEVIAVAGTLTGGNGNPTMVYGRYNGTLGSPTALGANDRVFNQAIRGYDGTTYAGAMAMWSIFAGSAWTGANHETYQSWLNVANGSTVQAERMRLSSAGALLVGTTAATGSELLNVHGNIVSSGTATVAGIIINAGSVVTAFGPNLINSSGTLEVEDTQGTITLSGTTTGTIAPAFNESFLVNVGTAAGTVSVSPGYTGQRMRLEIKQGATPHTVGFDTTVVFGTDVTSFTATAAANARDIVGLICMDGTHWGVGAIAHGFTI